MEGEEKDENQCHDRDCFAELFRWLSVSDSAFTLPSQWPNEPGDSYRISASNSPPMRVMLCSTTAPMLWKDESLSSWDKRRTELDPRLGRCQGSYILQIHSKKVVYARYVEIIV